MIIWLASYPKSGNTWVRIFLSSLIASTDNININDIKIEQFPQRYNFENLTKNISDVREFVKNCRLAEPGEFTKLAFHNNKIDLLKAESIGDLIHS